MVYRFNWQLSFTENLTSSTACKLAIYKVTRGFKLIVGLAITVSTELGM